MPRRTQLGRLPSALLPTLALLGVLLGAASPVGWALASVEGPCGCAEPEDLTPEAASTEGCCVVVEPTCCDSGGETPAGPTWTSECACGEHAPALSLVGGGPMLLEETGADGLEHGPVDWDESPAEEPREPSCAAPQPPPPRG